MGWGTVAAAWVACSVGIAVGWSRQVRIARRNAMLSGNHPAGRDLHFALADDARRDDLFDVAKATGGIDMPLFHASPVPDVVMEWIREQVIRRELGDLNQTETVEDVLSRWGK